MSQVHAEAAIVGTFEIPREYADEPHKFTFGMAIEFKDAADIRAALKGTPVVIHLLDRIVVEDDAA